MFVMCSIIKQKNTKSERNICFFKAHQEPKMTSQIIIRLKPLPDGSAKAVVSHSSAELFVLDNKTISSLKGPLIKSHNFWQRQKSRIKACSCRNAYCLSNEHNAEAGFLAKPHRASLQAVIFVVMPLAKGVTILSETCLEAYRL